MNSAIVQNNKGFSMVGVLAAGGMMGGLALFLAEMTKQQHVAQKVAETGVEITALHSRVVSLLADGEACKKTLEGTPVSPAPTITGFKNRKGRDVLAVPSPPFNRLVKLRDAKLTNIQGTGTTREVDVELTFEKLSKAISGQKTVKRLIPLTLELDTANTITSCHSPQNYVMKEQLCKEMGGTWNGSNKKCSVPDCSTGQALTKTSTGFACVSAGSLPNCPNGKIIKRVGGIWKCEDPPSGGGSPFDALNCNNTHTIGFDSSGVPLCVPKVSVKEITCDQAEKYLQLSLCCERDPANHKILTEARGGDSHWANPPKYLKPYCRLTGKGTKIQYTWDEASAQFLVVPNKAGTTFTNPVYTYVCPSLGAPLSAYSSNAQRRQVIGNWCRTQSLDFL